MHRFRTPELFLGCFLTVAIFATGMLFANWPQPQQVTQAQSADKPASSYAQKEDPKTFWQKVAADPVATFTLCLVVIAAAQAAFFVVQLSIMREGMKDATIAANAARDGAVAAVESARIARSAERPYIGPIKAELSYPGGDFIPEEGMPLTLEMDLQNFGKGLAFLLGYGIAHEVCQEGQEGGKPLIEPERFHGIRLSPGSIFKTKASYGLIRVPIKEYESFIDGSKCFFLYGYLRYLDLFGVIRRTSFSYEYITPPDDRKPLLVLNVRPNLWYDFEEDRPAQTNG